MVLAAGCLKISAGLEKLAPIGWHGWHVFSTPVMVLKLKLYPKASFFRMKLESFKTIQCIFSKFQVLKLAYFVCDKIKCLIDNFLDLFVLVRTCSGVVYEKVVTTIEQCANAHFTIAQGSSCLVVQAVQQFAVAPRLCSITISPKISSVWGEK